LREPRCCLDKHVRARRRKGPSPTGRTTDGRWRDAGAPENQLLVFPAWQPQRYSQALTALARVWSRQRPAKVRQRPPARVRGNVRFRAGLTRKPPVRYRPRPDVRRSTRENPGRGLMRLLMSSSPAPFCSGPNATFGPAHHNGAPTVHRQIYSAPPRRPAPAPKPQRQRGQCDKPLGVELVIRTLVLHERHHLHRVQTVRALPPYHVAPRRAREMTSGRRQVGGNDRRFPVSVKTL